MLSEHLRLEIAAAHHRGQPLEPGEPVPGCSCPECTGLPQDHPARRRLGARRPNGKWQEALERARGTRILLLARRLGLEPKRSGKAWMACCPFHEDRRPSFSISPDRGLWHCFSCGRGGDVIGLMQSMKHYSFAEAVWEIASFVES